MRRSTEMSAADLFLGILAIFFPPLPVWIKCGFCGADSLINILLCILGYLPGLLHAWYIIVKYPEPLHEYDYEAVYPDQESGRVTYVYAQGPNGCNTVQPHPHDAMNYGTQGAVRSKTHVKFSSSQQAEDNAATGVASSSNNQRGVPPSYAEVVAGDHKIQTTD